MLKIPLEEEVESTERD